MRRYFCLLTTSLAVAASIFAQTNYNEITLPELMKKKKSGDPNMVIVDVRSKGEYYDTTSRGKQSNIGRIKGAINITLQDLQQNPDAVKQLDAYRDKDIYLICSHSYRSRSASRILLNNGFTHVNNVQGGMTEWYRRYSELAPYRDAYLENHDIGYNNISPEEVYEQMADGKRILLLGIRNTPKFWYDSFNLKLYRYYPMPKNVQYYYYADSLNILDAVTKDKPQSIVLFNLVNNAAAELAEWLTQKGITNVSYLVGGDNLYYEYAQNKGGSTADKYFTMQSPLQFITPPTYCSLLQNHSNVELIDLRHDTVFNKVNDGVKHDYKHLKNSLNFFAGKGTVQFEKDFPDKKKAYVFIGDNYDGLAMADELARKGYKISWMIGGLDRWEWYMNNTEDFKCNDQLVE